MPMDQSAAAAACKWCADLPATLPCRPVAAIYTLEATVAHVPATHMSSIVIKHSGSLQE